MAYSTEVTHTQVGSSNTDFAVTFPFLDTTDIKVQLNGVTTSAFTIDQTGATKVVMTTAPNANDTIRIFRNTNIDAMEATYSAGSSIRSNDLNNNNSQLLYAAQEFGTLKEDNSVSFTLGSKGDIQVNSSSDWVIKTDAIELAMMSNNSVGTTELVDGCVTSAKLGSATITSSELANNSVTAAKIVSDAVTTNKIADNAVTVNKIPDNSITLAKLVTSISSLFAPVGSIVWYPKTTPPTGYFKCNGDAVPNGNGTIQGITANFTDLYNVVGTNLPDLRGEFIRALDDGRGIDSGRTVNSAQGGQNEAHTHTATASSTAAGGHTHNVSYNQQAVEDTGTAWTTDIRKDGGDGDGGSTAYNDNPGGFINTDGSHSHSVTASVASSGGTEARPRNVALLACIKY